MRLVLENSNGHAEFALTMENDIETIDDKLSTLEFELQGLEDEYDQKESEIDEIHREETNRLKDSYEAQLQVLQHRHALKMNSLHDEMEGKIEPVQDAILLLNRRRNALMPVFQLPSELLTAIFFEVQSTYYRPYFMKWTAVCHVCSHWRRVALVCEGLWSKINVSLHRKWMKVLLARSGDTPLDVSLNLSHWASLIDVDHLRENTQMAMAQSHRLESLELSAPSRTMDKLLLMLDFAAPVIRSLRLHTTTTEVWRIRIPPTIFRMHTPDLRLVAISGNSGDVQQCHLPTSVTELHLDSSLSKYQGSPTDLCDFFVRLPSLRHLSLHKAVKVNGEPSEDTHQLVSLESLVIKDWMAPMCTVLTHISAPALSSLHLECIKGTNLGWYHEHQSNPSKLFDCIAKLVQCNQPDRMLRNMEIDADEWRLVIAAWASTSQQPVFRLSLAELNHEEEAYAYRTVFEAVPLARLGAMVITADSQQSRVTKGTWPFVLKQVPGLTTLNISLRDVRDFLLCMQSSTAAVPRLRTLILQNADFGLPIKGDSIGGLLTRMVSLRHRDNIGLQILHLRRCWNVNAGDVDALRELVDAVVWDASVPQVGLA